jgi:hypothetical protein
MLDSGGKRALVIFSVLEIAIFVLLLHPTTRQAARRT